MLISGMISSMLCAAYCAAFGIKMFKQKNVIAGLICLAIVGYISYVCVILTIL